jgi:hypothetical protein
LRCGRAARHITAKLGIIKIGACAAFNRDFARCPATMRLHADVAYRGLIRDPPIKTKRGQAHMCRGHFASAAARAVH